jgi:Fe-S cluster assembly ATP-binding protein
MLTLKNIHIEINELNLLSDISLECKRGEICGILGPELSGKSALAQVIAGNPNFLITEGSIKYDQKSIKSLSPDKRNFLGISVSFQNPPDIEGLTNLDMLEYSLLSRNLSLDETFEKTYQKWCEYLGLGKDNKDDFVNHWSKKPSNWKKNELAHMFTVDSKFLVFDEIDQGLEQEVSEIATIIKNYIRTNNKSGIVFTKNQNFLNELEPDQSYILTDGKLIRSNSNNNTRILEK